MSGVVSTDVGTRFLEALERRDYDALGACLAPDATLRSILPPGLREDDGRDAIVRRFRAWTQDIDEYEFVAAAVEPCSDVLRLSWALEGLDPHYDGDGRSMFEQTAYAEVDDGLIAAMRLACTGRRPAP
jgi:ketosteroid isomerase-like protein